MKVVNAELVPRKVVIVLLKYVAQTSMSVVFGFLVDFVDFVLDIHHIRIGLIGLVFHLFFLDNVYLGGVVL